MTYKLLVLASGVDDALLGTKGPVSMIVLEFPSEGQADIAAEQIAATDDQKTYFQTEAIKLYLPE